MTKPISLHHLSLFFPHKICFDEFSHSIFYGNRIGIIGRNGSGKSSLLKMLAGLIEPSSGDILMPADHRVGYVPQVIEDFDSQSGGQRFNKALTQALALDPSVLLLDEPTNHLDTQNRRSLIRLLNAYPGTLLIVTHDVELLQHCVDSIWHIEDGHIHVFTGSYDDYRRELSMKRAAIEQELLSLARQKKDMHLDLMKEQTRAKTSRLSGEKNIRQRKWPTIVSDSKARNAQETSGRKKSAIQQKKQGLVDQLSELRLPEIIKPKFVLNGQSSHQTIVSISDGRVGYRERDPIVSQIRLSVHATDRIAITGNNGSGKSTLIKAILSDDAVVKQGEWLTPNPLDIGYLDQHYGTLPSEKTVLDVISEAMEFATHIDIRKHLNDFLFRKNEEVHAVVSTLSGGEKARLSLALIAAKTPKLLILDEVTNNVDLETRDHIIQVLKDYPGAMIVISHDNDFLNAIHMTKSYHIHNQVLQG